MSEIVFAPMEQQWGSTDPMLVSRFVVARLLERADKTPPVITTAGDVLPPSFVSHLDYEALIERCQSPTVWEPEPPVPLSRLLAVTISTKMGCWELPRYQDQKGRARYPIITSKRLGATNEGAHRVFYRQLVGPIPQGYFIDHRCHNKCCVWPRHVEPVTHAINNQRGHRDKKHRIQPQLWQPEPNS